MTASDNIAAPAPLSPQAGASAPVRGADPPIDALSGLLLESLAGLAEAGDVEAACRIAGRAYAVLRHENPQEARRFDLLLHRLSRRLAW